MVRKVHQSMVNINQIDMTSLIYKLYRERKISKKIAMQLLDQYHKSKERRRVLDMDGIIKFIIGCVAIWLVVTFFGVFLTLALGYMIYLLGEWIYNEWNSSSRD